MCTKCPGGTAPNSMTYAASSSSVCTKCARGTFAVSGDAFCAPCPSGSVSPAGSSTCTMCTSGSVPSTDLSVCIGCKAGTFANSTGYCQPCPHGTVSSPNSTICTNSTTTSLATANSAVPTTTTPTTVLRSISVLPIASQARLSTHFTVESSTKEYSGTKSVDTASTNLYSTILAQTTISMDQSTKSSAKLTATRALITSVTVPSPTTKVLDPLPTLLSLPAMGGVETLLCIVVQDANHHMAPASHLLVLGLRNQRLQNMEANVDSTDILVQEMNAAQGLVGAD
ncbi:hypothetical protein HK103_006518 [Boothiomyces macroporosus]|uniref:Tyrosine-protein kinase ephrin type A/B receptor-like domain-containing protein n=1 Tax=Boothiomyces macroporosus TaxID=261099 RepID=A0AAD5YAM9_9FUNG|nr:hypothetical protein HK103_006518 [Boothiomyces macroporosus]